MISERRTPITPLVEQVKEVVLRPQDGHFSIGKIVPQSRQIICDFMIDSPLNMRQILALFAVPV